jgi:hypothetical protein
MTVAATLALGYQAQATVSPIGTVTNTSKINVSITMKTNLFSSNGDLEKQTLKSAKINNKYLLDLFAQWASIEQSTTVTWPDGARLVTGWDAEWNGDVLVVDKTGTNVLYDATATDGNSTHYFEYYNDYFDDGAFTYNYLDASPGFYNYVDYDSGEFYLYDDDYYLDYTYLWGYYTPYTIHFNENWDVDGNYLKWSESGKFAVFGTDADFLDNQTTWNGSIQENGHGVGVNNYWGD